jgi:hypothetical protein
VPFVAEEEEPIPLDLRTVGDILAGYRVAGRARACRACLKGTVTL